MSYREEKGRLQTKEWRSMRKEKEDEERHTSREESRHYRGFYVDRPRVWLFVACVSAVPENPSLSSKGYERHQSFGPQIISPPSLWVRALPNWARLRYQRRNNGSSLRGKLPLHLTFSLVCACGVIMVRDSVPVNALTLVVPCSACLFSLPHPR